MSFEPPHDRAILPEAIPPAEVPEASLSFVQRVPSTLKELARCATQGAWEEMGLLADDLVCESHDGGFPPITRLAFQLESACRTEQDEAGILTAVEQLDTALRRVRLRD